MIPSASPTYSVKLEVESIVTLTQDYFPRELSENVYSASHRYLNGRPPLSLNQFIPFKLPTQQIRFFFFFFFFPLTLFPCALAKNWSYTPSVSKWAASFNLPFLFICFVDSTLLCSSISSSHLVYAGRALLPLWLWSLTVVVHNIFHILVLVLGCAFCYSEGCSSKCCRTPLIF